MTHSFKVVTGNEIYNATLLLLKALQKVHALKLVDYQCDHGVSVVLLPRNTDEYKLVDGTIIEAYKAGIKATRNAVVEILDAYIDDAYLDDEIGQETIDAMEQVARAIKSMTPTESITDLVINADVDATPYEDRHNVH